MHLKRRQSEALAACRLWGCPKAAANQRSSLVGAELAPNAGDKRHRSRDAQMQVGEHSPEARRSSAVGGSGGKIRVESSIEAGASQLIHEQTQTMPVYHPRRPNRTHRTRVAPCITSLHCMYLSGKPAAKSEHSHQQIAIELRSRETFVKSRSALLLVAAACLMHAWPAHHTASASVSSDPGSGENQLARQLIDIHRRIHILNRITQLASASKKRQQLADGLWDGHRPAQLEPLPQDGDSVGARPKAPGSALPAVVIGDKVVALEQPVAKSDAIQHSNTNELDEWRPRGSDMISALAMQQQRQHHNGQLWHQQPQQQPSRSTTPTINRQLPGPGLQVLAPTVGYELGVAPADAVQLVLPPGTSPVHSNGAHQFARDTLVSPDTSPPARPRPQDWQISAETAAAESIARPSYWPPPATTTATAATTATATTATSTTARPRDPRTMFQSERDARDSDVKSAVDATNSLDSSETLSAGSQVDAGKSEVSAGDSSNQERSQMTNVQLKAEPRQRRRIFNRILKKAEWNHLFLELSKVFLRYFLDLALKDIIGKQSGSTTSDSSTTGRKKLEVQSELTDMLKEFIKTAITNI